MRTRHFTFKDPEGVELFVYCWLPEEGVHHKAVVQIVHGMAETAQRYERFAQTLTDAGYVVYANDHRGHGKTAGHPDEVGTVGCDGFHWMTQNVIQLADLIRKEHETLPIYLFGHSMGSFIVQKVMYESPQKINGIILSGTNGRQGLLLHLGIYIAKREAANKGDRYRSKLLDKLSFGGYNKSFHPARTPFDWLSRDPAEVDKYMEDPFCGVVFTAGFYRDFLSGLNEIHMRRHMRRIPTAIPVYLFSGGLDPVGRKGKGVIELVNTYRKLGLQQVSYKLYPGGRHEMLNEINREEVMADVITWLDHRVILDTKQRDRE